MFSTKIILEADGKSNGNYVYVPARLQELRAELGLTLEQLERLSGVSRRTIRRYENGERELDASYLLPILAALAGWLLLVHEESHAD